MKLTTEVWKLLCRAAVLVCALGSGVTLAATLEVRVLDRDGNPVPEVAVFAEVTGAEPPANTSTELAVMDQRDTRFVPHVLVIQKGTSVTFPNSDVIAHHVYSFSKPNNFVLPLYKGVTPDPVTFEHDGIVTLGCNIHDQMLAYIVVVDTNTFAVTDSNGFAELEVEDSDSGYDVSIWSARIRDSKGPIVQHVSEGQSVEFSLQKKLRAPHDHESDSVRWSEY